MPWTDARERLKEKARTHRKPAGWILPKQESSWAPPGTWTNIDLDVTPLDRRTWGAWTLFGYWFGSVITIQSWQTGSTILALGLTWREAVLAVVLGSCVMGIPMALNGYAGAKSHIPFPVLARASFGYHLAKFPVVLRLITALFWHAITNYLAVAATTQVIRSIWPSFLTMHNSIPEDQGITSQSMISYFLFWLVQFPLLMIPPEKLRWLFDVKIVMCTGTIVGTVIWTCMRAGGSGDIWDQQPQVSGSTKAWLTMWALNSCTASWSTVGMNIPDFTRYMRKPTAALTQAVCFPAICSWVAVIGIVVASASIPVYAEVIWDPVAIMASWDGAGGRAAAFFAGLSWMIAQICCNSGAVVISGANDLTNLFPKYFNIRRGSIFITIIGGWAFVPWKILHSANSLLSFMSSLGIFLAPIMGIQIADFFVVKRQRLDIPELYQPYGRYRFYYGVNWRAAVAFIVAWVPCVPGLAYNVNNNTDIGGAIYIADFNWYYGFFTALILYSVINFIWPHKLTLVPYMIEGIRNPEEEAEIRKEADLEKSADTIVDTKAVPSTF